LTEARLDVFHRVMGITGEDGEAMTFLLGIAVQHTLQECGRKRES
jgi:hypothetical protein